jgi:hypothetical protein
VALLCPSPGIPALAPGGASVHLRGLASGFASAGADTRLFVRRMRRGGDNPDVPAPEGLRIEEAPRGRLPGVLRKRRAWDEAVDARAMERWVARECAGWRPDLIYERWSLFSALGRGLRRRVGAPWVLEVNAPLAWEACWFEGLEASPGLLRREEQTLRAADRVLVVSQPLKDYVLRRGVEEERVLLVPNGVSCAGPALRGAPAGEAPFILGYEGTFKPWQGMLGAVPQLVGLMRSVAPRRLQLDLWGDGPQREALRSLLGREVPELVTAWRGWGEPDRSTWDAAWVPLASWPPSSTEIEEVFGEAPPERYFSPLKEAAARAWGLPVWYGDGRGLVEPTVLPATWSEIARGLLDLGIEIGQPASRLKVAGTEQGVAHV